MSRQIGLLAACDSPKLFNVHLYPEQRRLLESLERTPNAVWACGRRGGKTRLAAIVCLHGALFRPDLDELVIPGEVRFSVSVAVNLEQARTLIRAAKLIVDNSPVLRAVLRSVTVDELLFGHPDGAVTGVRAFPCSSRGLRGYPISTAVMDEAAHHVTSEDGDQAAKQVFEALRPSMAQFGPAGTMLVISSPMGNTGFFAEQWQKAHDGVLVGWEAHQVSTADMNPGVTPEYLAQLEAEQPETFGSEYMALFESGGSAFFDMERFDAVDGLGFAEPTEAVAWTAGLDPALTSDSFGLALVGRDQAGKLVVGPAEAIEPERKHGWTAELKRDAFDRVLARVGQLCCEYSASAVTDQHESQVIKARLAELGVRASIRGMTREVKLNAFRELRDRLYDGSLLLPDHPMLLDELARVKLNIKAGGAEISLPRSARGHCDMAQALALAVYEMRFSAPAGPPRAWTSRARPVMTPDVLDAGLGVMPRLGRPGWIDPDRGRVRRDHGLPEEF